MKEKTLTVKKSSAFIQTNARGLTLTQRKIINAFIHIAQKEGNQKRYYFPTTILKEYCGITMKGNDNLKQQLRGLMKIVLEFNYLGKDKKWVWEASVLIPSTTIRAGSKYTEFEFTECLKEKILRPDMYTPLNILLIAGLKSIYAIVLYEFLKDYLTAPAIPVMTIKQFRNLLGVEDNKYMLFQNFKVWVLDKAVNEVNGKTDIHCSYKLIKEHGNKYSHIGFKVEKKENYKYPKLLETELNEYSKAQHSSSITSKEHTEVKENARDKLDDEKVKTLTSRGITEKVAEVLVRKYPDRISDKIKVCDWLKKGEDNRVSKNPAGYLRKSIEENYPLPDDYVAYIKEEKARRLREERERRESEERRKEDLHHRKIVEILNEMEEKESEEYKLLEQEAREKTESQLKDKKLDPSMYRMLLKVGIGAYMNSYAEKRLGSNGEELEREKGG